MTKLQIAAPPKGTKEGGHQPKLRRPPGLSPAAVRFWNRYAPPLIEAGVLCKLDLDSFVQLCEVASNLEDCREGIKEHGVLVEGTHGTLKKNPALSCAAQLYQQYRLLASDFALTPASRAKLGLTNADLLEAAELAEAERFLFGDRSEK